MYTIGKLAEISNVSVRTLRYYDEIGLLPAVRDEQGHRVYAGEDVSKLHYILTLRNIGLPLETIADALHTRDLTTKDLLHMRLNLIREEQKKLRDMEAAIQSLLSLPQMEQSTDWHSVFNTFYAQPNSEEVLKKVWDRHFTKEEQDVLQAFPRVGENNRLAETALALFKDVRANMHSSPASETAQQIAHRWVSLVDELYQGNDKLADKVWELNRKHEVTGLMQFEEEMMTFIEQAIADYNGTAQKDLADR